MVSEDFHTFTPTIHHNQAQMRLCHVILYILMLSAIAPARGQTSGGSSIASLTVLSSDTARVLEQRVYDNGLGDVIQEVQSGITGTVL